MSLAVAAHKAVHDILASPSSPMSSADTALAGYIAGRVYDRVQAGKPSYPYLVIEIDIADDANTCSNASIMHATVHVWSNKVGSIEAKSIGGLVRTIMAPDDPNDTALDIEGYVVSSAAFDVEVYRPGEDTLLTEGVLSFTYLVDPE